MNLNTIKIIFKNEISKLNNFFTIKKLCEETKNFKGNDPWEKCYRELVKNGITKIPVKLQLTDEIRDINYFKENKNFNDFIILKKKLPPANDYGKSTIEIDINSKIFKKIFTKDLLNLINLYYRKKFWLRNAPILSLDEQAMRKYQHTQSYFHIDHGQRQLSMGILLNDLNENCSHTEYLMGTNQISWFGDIRMNRTDKSFQSKVAKYISKNDKKKIIGKSGDIFLFDAGNGLHKAIYGTDRLWIHLNFAQNRSYANYNNHYEEENVNGRKDYWSINIDDEFKDYLSQNFWKGENFYFLNNNFF